MFQGVAFETRIDQELDDTADLLLTAGLQEAQLVGHDSQQQRILDTTAFLKGNSRISNMRRPFSLAFVLVPIVISFCYRFWLVSYFDFLRL